MKERPILFSGAMVRAILEGRKTQTRRVMKPMREIPDALAWHEETAVGLSFAEPGAWAANIGGSMYTGRAICPYGVPGDQLWVREAFQPLFAHGVGYEDTDWQTGKGYAPRYVATDGCTEWMDLDDKLTDRCKPGIHMPRWASRITLEITDVRVQRLQEISEEDALSEGVTPTKYSEQDIADIQISDAAPHIKELARILGPGQVTAKCNFIDLWNSINAKRGFGWDVNPWVWAVSFKKL